MKHPYRTPEYWTRNGSPPGERKRILAHPGGARLARLPRTRIPDMLDPLEWQLEDREAFPLDSSGSRCSERGCVFPAQSQAKGKCAYHDRIEREPALFHSWQPTLLLLERAKFGLPDSLPDDSRSKDRRRLSALREEFFSGGTS